MSNIVPAEVYPLNKGKPKLCTLCGNMKSPEGGFVKLLDNGRRQRWMCNSCGQYTLGRLSHDRDRAA